MKPSSGAHQNTRERLLKAAGEIFARHGFRAATVREIALRAKANVAAVNYHFGDKKKLYAAVLKYAHNSATQKYHADQIPGDGITPQEQLHAFVQTFLLRILDEGRPAWHGKLMMREIFEPTEILDEMIEETIRPLYERLSAIIRQLIGEKAATQLVQRCTLSVIGQCVHYYHARPVIARLTKHKLGPSDIEKLADHITQFSLAAIAGLAAKEH